MPLLIISGCSRTQFVPVNQPKLNPELTASTPVPKVVTPFRWGDSLELNAKLFVALGQCNQDKQAIREIEEKRNGSNVTM
ncbi:Rz1-like lysis system protein LysC [Serratia fonticola]|uniref:Rz1-like lysis system protein LysC n=1 Tax=Serratia fonticola TaxID=47917 RepID=UPI004037E299